jgi:hypothetical protein
MRSRSSTRFLGSSAAPEHLREVAGKLLTRAVMQGNIGKTPFAEYRKGAYLILHTEKKLVLLL